MLKWQSCNTFWNILQFFLFSRCFISSCALLFRGHRSRPHRFFQIAWSSSTLPPFGCSFPEREEETPALSNWYAVDRRRLQLWNTGFHFISLQCFCEYAGSWGSQPITRSMPLWAFHVFFHTPNIGNDSYPCYPPIQLWCRCNRQQKWAVTRLHGAEPRTTITQFWNGYQATTLHFLEVATNPHALPSSCAEISQHVESVIYNHFFAQLIG